MNDELIRILVVGTGGLKSSNVTSLFDSPPEGQSGIDQTDSKSTHMSQLGHTKATCHSVKS